MLMSKVRRQPQISLQGEWKGSNKEKIGSNEAAKIRTERIQFVVVHSINFGGGLVLFVLRDSSSSHGTLFDEGMVSFALFFHALLHSLFCNLVVIQHSLWARIYTREV